MSLVVEDLRSGYTGIDVVHDVSIKVPTGTMVAILGANGAGKTALLRGLTSLNHVRSGLVHWNGASILGIPPARLARLGIAHVPQGRALFGAMSVLENLELGAYLCTSGEESAKRLAHVFHMFPVLKQRAWQPAAYLSGGEQQMLAVGRALMARPTLLVLDEPSTGLAPKVFAEIVDKVADVRREGVSILISEQSVRRILKIANYCYVIENGRIVLEGTGDELRGDPRIEKAYLGTHH